MHKYHGYVTGILLMQNRYISSWDHFCLDSFAVNDAVPRELIPAITIHMKQNEKMNIIKNLLIIS